MHLSPILPLTIISAVCFLALYGMAFAAAPERSQQPVFPHAFPEGYVCYRADRPLTINGKLEEAAWKDAPWTSAFVDIEGTIRPKPRFRTRAKMLWDAEYLYIGAELEEPHVWATLTEHDSVIFYDNDFEVFIDPDGDNHQYYEIEINALNTEWDLRLVKPYRDGGPALNEWEIPGFKSAVHIAGTLNDPSDTDRGWTVEMAIPWKALGEFANRPAPPRDGDQWRINFSRVEWEIEIVDGKYRKLPDRPEDNWVWSPQYVIDMHRPERWGYIQFSTLPPDRKKRERFRPDPAYPARETLIQIYYAQRERHEKTSTWATSLVELGLTGVVFRDVTFLSTPEGYEASLPVLYPDGMKTTWHVRQDSRLWEEGVRR